MIFRDLDELDPALAAPVRAFLEGDAPVTVARVALPAPAVAAFRTPGRVLLLVDERVPDERVEAVVQLAERVA